MRKLLIGLGAIVAMVAIVCGLVFFAPWFAVKSIDVRGAEHASVEEIQQASGVMVGEQLVSVDAPSAARQVVALPWVKTATVSKKWPSTVSVAVIEQQAVAYVKTAEGTTLVNADGVPFVIDEAPLGTVEISGASVDDPAVFSACLAVVGALPEGVRKEVARVQAPSQYEITLELLDGRSVYWGSAEQAHNKAVATELVLARPGERFNVSNPQLVTVD
ncbi:MULTISPECIES: cell division protein FtsQ/DivIB [Corynebacterium]|uniref:FtsQ-type POTRA domain-containing protein n=1 Tax=Corynebacterium glucuronolyticum TaxID=39791 RepID=A0A7T4ED77_9CORY|nr:MULTISPECIES: FtsQ-type POTRA domain-containing protein [Corynebacterium]MCT1441227.1 FtsQ-type POTRA domain-containing protein [Corynebacterium glucuronolyticum]MCT1562273.1 FtsQ-type POTRA domain-containing protein [Corynebacterium glucuronolyticum]OFO43870.1 cell division protein FtsQ [Corynebacterium sp. HMSC073D01]QQB45425.1 FtsQ-type POTRA domain-containing protein [Corynebacterium glucuronolyticum]QQU89275.1 FtsQ-type POTRA domain-containing protein [Corynebacterium glucuronolyticum]